MPDENSSQAPSTNLDSQTLTPTPDAPLPVQGEVFDCGKPEAEKEKQASGKLMEKLHPIHHATFWVQLCLGVIGIAAILIYWGQLCEMRKTTKLTQDSVTNADRNFRRDERAWIGFSFVPGNLTFTIGKSFFVPTLLTNTGKTPAKNVQGNIVVGVFERGKPLDFSFSGGHANYRIAAGTIFPNGSITESFQAIKHDKDKAEAIVLDKPLMHDILSSRSLVLVHGKITYFDIFGIEHWTTYCRVVSNPSLIPDDCTRYNDTDSN